MKQVTTRVVTPRSPEEVHAYLVDFDNQAEWRFDVLASERGPSLRKTAARYEAALAERLGGQADKEDPTP